jgi:hypothetical protein
VLRAAGLKWDDVFPLPGEQKAQTSVVQVGVREFCPEEGDLDEVYRVLLGKLPLYPHHHEDLKRRGLSDEAISLGLYRSVGVVASAIAVRECIARFGAERLLVTPGFVETGDHFRLAVRSGLIIPVRTPDKLIRACQVRSEEGAEVLYLWLSGNGGPVSKVKIHWSRYDPRVTPYLVTEGPLKADVINHLLPALEVNVLGIPGVSHWRSGLKELIGCGATEVWLAFDMDWRCNFGVRQSLCDFVQRLQEANVAVKLVVWEDAKGFDDCLAAGLDWKLVAEREMVETLNGCVIDSDASSPAFPE